ncbi:BTB/POZ domain-containing adapter for CUL3-mediated RhoA degradation protein [Acrasis kona]|uniref:BTB/POZ domain-containing adapter for CUL3-mediated RhoA degradation protein n=1 Tax=Acrasis kona TaxID=1008807 RepID=A0AAW2ZDP3_9EUKA
MSKLSGQWVVLNVGGIIHHTTRDTLTTYCQNEPHMLSTMFSDDTLPLCVDEKQRVLIDRNGKIFSYILDFLRCGGDLKLCSFPVHREDLMHSILLEADYFQMQAVTNFFRGPVPEPKFFCTTSKITSTELEGEGWAVVSRPLITNPGVFNRHVRGYNAVEIMATGSQYKQEIVGRQMGIAIANQSSLLNFTSKTVTKDELKFLYKVNAFDVEAMMNGYKRQYKKMSMFYDAVSEEIWVSDQGEQILFHGDIRLDPKEEWHFVVFNNATDINVRLRASSFRKA